ncbi:hypothetical protein J2N86_05085 [Legionella lytica]|uniref:DUF7790 domain-containing protein n=1 Tax=Legionella lytica TaxID=96232 RepID=A0ABY4YAP2_9GAMM|nr:hypothetical protein [Legionella lytica]USQ14680.1 hypothetical protein J2N86_05085 [Legionella lytica]
MKKFNAKSTLFMSTARIYKLLSDGLPHHIPVPHHPPHFLRQDPISKHLRKHDNKEIKFPFPNQTGVYINTNEHYVKPVFDQIGLFPQVIDAMHIGFSGWHNFDIMVQRKSSRGIICDINPENALFMHYTLKYLIRCANKDEFIQKMTQFVKKNQYEGSRTNFEKSSYHSIVKPKSIKFSLNISEEYPDHYAVIEEIALEQQRETSWLFTDERYDYIRALALTDKIAVITQSICEHETFARIRRLLTENSIPIDTVYVSNIGEWMCTKEQKTDFIETISLLLNDNETILIDARINNPLNNEPPSQRCTLKKEIIPKFSLRDWFFSGVEPKEIEEPAINNMTVA